MSSRTALGALAAAGAAAGFALVFAVSSSAAPPSLGLAATDAVIGQTIHATAQLSESETTEATGEISFEVFGPGDSTCSGPALSPAPASASVEGEGEYASGSFTPSVAGVYRWSAHYSGDSENSPADAACAAVSIVDKANPELTGDASDGAVNTSIHDEVTMTGGFSASGEVIFRVYGPNDTGCVTPLKTDAVPIQSGHATSAGFLAQHAGEFRWRAEYQGDANNEATSTSCGAPNQSSTVAKASPGLSGTATSTAVVGSPITDSVTLSGGFNPGGQIVFRAFGPADQSCAGPAKYEEAVAVNGNGSYSPSGFSPAAGLYRWTAEYEGDANNKAANTACGANNQSSSVGKASPGLSGTATSAVAVGSPITDSVTLSGGFSPGGQIVFRAFGPANPSCAGAAKYEEAVAVNGNGSYSPAGFSPAAGLYRWTAEYGGDGNNEAAGTSCGAPNQSSTVEKASPGLSGTATSTVVVGSPITDSVTLSGGFSPSGQIVFRAFGPGDQSCAGPAKYEEAVAVNGNGSYSPAGFSPAAVGLYRWTAEYGGDGNNEAASTSCGAPNQSSVVEKASPGLSGTATPTVVVGSSITDSVTLSGGFNPGGQIVFRAFGPANPSCAGPAKYEEAVAVNGNGSYSPAGISPGVGVYRWTTEYEGDANNEAASTACGAGNQSSTVNKASPGLSGTATSTVVVGSPITDSVTLSGGFNAGGQIVFRAFGPGDQSCAGPAKYEEAVAVNGNGSYSPTGFSPGVGVYRWTAVYGGDASNESASTPCGAPNQSSTVEKASPGLSGTATSTVVVGSPITDSVTLSGGFSPSGQIVFRAFGAADQSCAGPAEYEEAVAVNGSGSYSPAGFSPAVGLYRWTAEYGGDASNEAASTQCGENNQSSAVGTISLVLAASAANATIGNPITATASLQEGAIPAGQIAFKAFPPTDANCSGPPAFSSTVGVSGNGSYRSGAFATTRVGVYRWTVSYSGDPNHAPATVGCGKATSSVSQARPALASSVSGRLTVGASFQITAALNGGYAPAGAISFQIYGPGSKDCFKPLSVDTVPVAGHNTVSSDPFVPQRPGRYSFVATYSGDAANQGATEPCNLAGRFALVNKRAPKVKPRAHLTGSDGISIRARLSGALSPSGAINFRLYRPGDKLCKRKPAFGGSVTVKSNGSYLLGEYVATKPGTYLLSVGYSGDARNQRYRGSCAGAQAIPVG